MPGEHTGRAAPAQLPSTAELLALYQRSEAERERLAQENAQLKARRQGPLAEDELNIGTHVAARSGTEYVPAEVTDIFTSVKGGERLYGLTRLDDGRKGLSPKPASDLFPPERATTGS